MLVTVVLLVHRMAILQTLAIMQLKIHLASRYSWRSSASASQLHRHSRTQHGSRSFHPEPIVVPPAAHSNMVWEHAHLRLTAQTHPPLDASSATHTWQPSLHCSAAYNCDPGVSRVGGPISSAVLSPTHTMRGYAY